MSTIEVAAPVIIVGGGPAGLITSLLLSKYGVRHVLVEKYPTMAHTPRAHIINQRTVEILRDLGLQEEFGAIAMPWELMRNTVWHQSLSGLELARLQSWGTSPERNSEYVTSSPCEMANCGQHLLEPLLFAAVQRSDFADVRTDYEVNDVGQDHDGAYATATHRRSGQELTFRGDYLVGSDGGRSVVARSIGLRYEGQEGLAASATIHFHADLSRYTARRPGALYWNAVPGQDGFRGAGTLICHQPWHDWALAFSYDPHDEDATDPALALARLRRVIGDDSVPIEIKNISTWTINRLVATSYSVGRVFCMGDAVHRHPPTNGLGLNTSVQDAYNLAWKLAWVLHGRATPSLLETYSQERQPVGRRIVERAFASIDEMAATREAFGFDATQDGLEAERAIQRLFEPGAAGEKRRAAVAEAIDRTNYQFNAHGVEVGYRYRSGAIVADGTPEPPPSKDVDLFYEPTTWPGAHLPHAWLDDGQWQLSTFDVVAAEGFTLLTGIGGEPWLDAAAAASASTGVPVVVRFIGTDSGITDSYGDWRRLAEVSESGCVLVRPDRHVAWRADDASAVHTDRLVAVLAALVGRS